MWLRMGSYSALSHGTIDREEAGSICFVLLPFEDLRRRRWRQSMTKKMFPLRMCSEQKRHKIPFRVNKWIPLLRMWINASLNSPRWWQGNDQVPRQYTCLVGPWMKNITSTYYGHVTIVVVISVGSAQRDVVKYLGLGKTIEVQRVEQSVFLFSSNIRILYLYSSKRDSDADSDSANWFWSYDFNRNCGHKIKIEH